MKVGDLVEYYHDSRHWGIILAVSKSQYEVFWMDGDRSWISKLLMVKKCP